MPGLDELRKDLAANVKTMVGITEVSDLVAHLRHTLWPFLEAVVDEMVDLEEGLLELAEEHGDMLTTETAGIFANVILISVKLADALKDRLRADELDLGQQIDAFKVLCDEATTTLADITVTEMDDEEEDPHASE